MPTPAIDREAVLPAIYAEVAAGRSLAQVLGDEGMPSAPTFWRWHMEDEAIRDNLARARELGVERLMDECVDIADDGTNDYVKRQRADGSIEDAFDGEHVQRSKLRIDTRMKYAQMIAPRKYAPTVKHADADGGKIAIDDTTRVTRLAAMALALQSRIDADAAD